MRFSVRLSIIAGVFVVGMFAVSTRASESAVEGNAPAEPEVSSSLGSSSADASLLLDGAAVWNFAPKSDATDFERWQFGAIAATGQGAAPLGVATTGASADATPAARSDTTSAADCKCTPVVTLQKEQRQNVFFAWTSFEIAASKTSESTAVLEIKSQYRDAIVIAINGYQVATGNGFSALSADTQVPATRRHGPEWETFYVQVAPGLLHPGRNIVAVQVRAHEKQLGPWLQLQMRALPSVDVVIGPVIREITTNSAMIWAEMSAPAPASLRWRAATKTQWTQIDSSAKISHSFTLQSLPSGRIDYQLVGANRVIASSFFTAPTNSQTLRLAVYGDVRGGHQTHRRIIDSMLSEAPDAVISSGDMVLRGSDEADWQRFFAVIAPLISRVAFYTSIGNHDLGRASATWSDAANKAERNRRQAVEMFIPPSEESLGPQTWYSRDLAGVHLVFLDSNQYQMPAQLEWLVANLQKASADPAVRSIIAVTHAGPFSRGVHRGSKIARDAYVPVLAKYVDLLISGHEHQYQRGEKNGLRYLVTGGGGASLYPITCGTSATKKCAIQDGMQAVAKEHHYVMLTINDSTLEMCPRRPDATPLEACTQFALRQKR
jgi:acid phosphatase type 7